jgi:hypothetical protein
MDPIEVSRGVVSSLPARPYPAFHAVSPDHLGRPYVPIWAARWLDGPCVEDSAPDWRVRLALAGVFVLEVDRTPHAFTPRNPPEQIAD